MNNQPPPIFLFDGEVVGGFTSGYPSSTGDFDYMPYRGHGHYRLGLKMKKDGVATCSFTNGAERLTLTITGSPKYGVLTASELKKEAKTVEPSLGALPHDPAGRSDAQG